MEEVFTPELEMIGLDDAADSSRLLYALDRCRRAGNGKHLALDALGVNEYTNRIIELLQRDRAS